MAYILYPTTANLETTGFPNFKMARTFKSTTSTSDEAPVVVVQTQGQLWPRGSGQ